MKPTCFLGTARRDLAAFPELARRQAGYELFMVQVGREPADFEPLPTVGSGAYEIRIRDAAGAFRVVYVAKFKEAVYPPSQKTTAVRPWMNAGADPPKLGERRRVLRRISPKK
jgi:hypothetical protein